MTTTSTTNEEIVAALTANAKQRKASEDKQRRLREEADALIVAGHLAGVPKLTLANAAGLTRQTVYTVLLKAQVTT
jgi:DNA invertase Pin-like site-specific DNA recombinase